MSAVDIQPVGTPNPRSVKFLTDHSLLPAGSADFRDPESARRSPLALRLFDLDGVEGVFISQNFVTVTAQTDGEWARLSPEIVREMRVFLESGESVLDGELDAHGSGEGDVERRIKDILDQQIRPAVAMDGGDIIFVDFSDGIVHLRMSGACGGCPSSTATLKAGIEARLRHFIPEVESVEAV
jgi:Fe-S cluster biogenesis protein NfuA